jgi:hypothetical protein
MNSYAQSEAQHELATQAETPLIETILLAEWGFTAEEITSLLWLRQWYQNGGSDRAVFVRHLEFLRFLVQNGAISL